MGKKPIHEQVVEILPWYVNNALEKREEKKVLAHLGSCVACQAERDRLQQLHGLLQEESAVLPDYRFAYAKLASRIEAAEANRDSTRGFGRANARAGNHFGYMLGAAASFAAAVMLVALLDRGGSAGDGRFHTLTTAPMQENAGVPHLVALRFEHPIQAETLRKVLVETRASIVSGPSDGGTYLVELSVPPDTSDSAFIRQIEGIDGISFAAFSDSAAGQFPE